MPKEFVVITNMMDDEKTNKIVIRAFEENNNQAHLGELIRRLVEEIEFSPVVIYRENDPRLQSYREQNFYVYEIKDGVVYRFPPIP